MQERTWEWWVVLVASMLFVGLQRRGDTLVERMAIAGLSGGLGFAFAPELVARGWMGELAAMSIAVALSYAVLETALAVVKDRRAIMDIVRARIGGRK